MIEPQNSLIPLAAEPRPADAPQGDSVAFGEMLAQSLGLVAQADPNAVQQINNGEDQQHGQSASDDADQGSLPSQRTATPLASAAAPRASTQQPSSIVRGPLTPAFPVEGADFAPGAKEDGGRIRFGVEPTPIHGSDGPIRALPTPPSPVATPSKVEPIDGIWKPGLAASTENIGAQTVVDAADAAAQAPVQPVVGPEEEPAPPPTAVKPASPKPVPVEGIDPGPRPPVQADPSVPTGPMISSEPAPVVRDSNFVAAPIESRPEIQPQPISKPGTGRRIPTPPSPLGELAAAPEGPTASAGLDQSSVSADALFAPRVNLTPDAPVYLGDSHRVASAPVTGNVAEPAVPVATEATGQIDSQHSVLAGEAPFVSAPASDAGGDRIPLQSSALAERVMQAVDLQRTQPPPRSMVVDIPEIEGLRLVVSVRSGGQVSVTPAIGSTNPDAFAPFTDDLSRVLSDRGFAMTGDGQRRGNTPYATDDQQPTPRRRQPFRRSAPTDNDLRI